MCCNFCKLTDFSKLLVFFCFVVKTKRGVFVCLSYIQFEHVFSKQNMEVTAFLFVKFRITTRQIVYCPLLGQAKQKSAWDIENIMRHFPVYDFIVSNWCQPVFQSQHFL